MAFVFCVSLLPPAAFAENEGIADVLQNEEVRTEEIAEQAERENALAVQAANAEDKPQGDGTENSPYLIGTLEELKWFRDTVNGGETDIYAKLTENISFNETWEPIGTAANQYIGVFDGNGFQIKLNSISGDGEIKDWGIFGYIGSGGKVQDLYVYIMNLGRNYKTLNASQIGILAAYNAGTIERCTATDGYQFYVSGTVGLLVYQNDGTIRDCMAELGFSHGDLGSVGGIVYQNNGSIRNCFFNSALHGNIGMNNHAIAFENGIDGSITYCYYRYGRPNVDNTEGVEWIYNSEVEAGKATVMLNNDGDAQGSKTDPWRISSTNEPSLKKTDRRVRYDSENEEYVIESEPHMHGEQEFTWVKSLSDITDDGYYCIDSAIQLESVWNVNHKVTLCLNGQTITANSGITAIEVNDLGSLTLLDCSQNNEGKITGGKIGIYTTGEFIMQGGEITGNKTGIYAISGLTVGGKAKVIGNDNQNILLSRGAMLYFNTLEESAKFGISMTDQDTLADEERVTVTDENGGQYFDQLVADGFDENGENGFALYLSEDGTTVTFGKQRAHKHCICGDGSKTVNGHTHDEESITFKPWTAADSLPQEGNYYLTRNVTLAGDADLINVNICLNGYTVTLPDSGTYIQTGANGYNNQKGSLTDCIGTGTITGNCIFIERDSTINLYGGTLSGTRVEIGQTDGGTFNMYGGKITGNETTAIIGNSSNNKVYINMYGGEISGNNGDADVYGGGVYVDQGNQFNMYGGTISGNSAKNGGGVYISDGGTFTMSGGEISGNTGGVYAGGTLNLSGSAAINGNTVNGSQNNVYLPDSKNITVINELFGTTPIGVTTAVVPADGKPVRFAVSGGSYTLKETDKDHFKSDADDTCQSVYNDGAIWLAVKPHEHPVNGGENVIWQPINNETELCSITNTGSESVYCYLTQDIKLNSGTWTPVSGVVLDLNGHNITANGAFDTITVGENVNFTLTDCKGTGSNYGSITHETDPATKPLNSKYNGRGVNVSANGRFIMYDGSIGGNLSTEAGAGVNVADGAVFAMYGGEIGGNLVSAAAKNNGGGICTAGNTIIGGNAKIFGNAAQTAGGVYVSGGTLTLEDSAKVTGNTATNYRNGIFVSAAGTLRVSGSVRVTENLYNGIGSNVYLEANGSSVNPISVVGALDDSASIGVSVADTVLKSINDYHFVTIAAADTEGWIKNGSFISEHNNTYAMIVSDDGKTAQLGTHPHQWTYRVIGTAIKAECSNPDCAAGGSVTIVPPDEDTLTYDSTPKAATLEGNLNTGVVPEITYEVKKIGEPFTPLLPEGSVPTDAGEYRAFITVGGATANVEYIIQKAKLNISDFKFTPPESLIYDGTEKFATVTSDKIDSSYIKVTYWFPKNEHGWGWAANTANAGTYFVRIQVEQNTNYEAINDSIADEENWQFTILPSVDYTVHIPERWNAVTEVIEGSKFAAAIAAINDYGRDNVTVTGVNNDVLYGNISWYTDEACTKPVDTSTVIDGTAGTTVQLYWKFVFGDEYPNENYVTEDKIGSVDVKIVDGPEQKLFFYDISGRSVTEGFAKYGDSPIRIQAGKDFASSEFTYGNSNPEVAAIDVDANDNITITICGVGTTNITATVAMVPGLYAKTTITYTLTVAKGEWKNVSVSMPTDSVYNKKPQTPSLFGYSGDYSDVTYFYSDVKAEIGSGKWRKWDLENPPQLDAGTYYMYAIIKDTAYYYAAVTGIYTFNVQKAYPTCNVPVGLTAKYGQKLSDIELTNPEGNTPGTWSWKTSEAVFDQVGSRKYYADFKPDNPNYEDEVNIEIDVNVVPADGGNLKTVELTQKYTYTNEHTYTPDWSGLPVGQNWTYSSEANKVLHKQDFAADGSLLTYAVTDGKAGDRITITLKASCGNYEDFTITLNITLTDRDEQAALLVSGDTAVVYGQNLQLSVGGGSGTGAVTYAVSNVTGEAAIDADGRLTPIKVGTVEVTAAKADDVDYKEVISAPFVITITPAASAGEPNYTKITGKGKTLKDAALTTDGSTLKPNAGKPEWIDDDGNVLPDDTRVEANKIYKWRFTPDDSNYTVLIGEVELYHVSSSGGGSVSPTYTVSFDTNGGSELSKQRVAKNNTIKEPTAPTKEDFDFAGWYTDKELKEKYDFSAKVTKNITLYAAWTEKDNSANQIILTIGEKDALVFGTVKANDVAPKIVKDRTMLPARFVAENLGADVLWDGEKELVTIKGKHLKTGEDITILIYIGSDIAYVNGKEIKLDSAAFIENDRTYTPIRFISEELGAGVEWIEKEQKVVITKQQAKNSAYAVLRILCFQNDRVDICL